MLRRRQYVLLAVVALATGIVLIGLIGTVAYNLGLAQGMASGLPAPGNFGAPFGRFAPGPFDWAFGLARCLVPLFGLLLLLALLRAFCPWRRGEAYWNRGAFGEPNRPADDAAGPGSGPGSASPPAEA